MLKIHSLITPGTAISPAAASRYGHHRSRQSPAAVTATGTTMNSRPCQPSIPCCTNTPGAMLRAKGVSRNGGTWDCSGGDAATARKRQPAAAASASGSHRNGRTAARADASRAAITLMPEIIPHLPGSRSARRDCRPRVGQTRRPAVRPVLEVPPLVVVHAVQVVSRAVSFEPAGAFDRADVERDAGDVARLVRRQRPVPGERGRAGPAHRGGEQPGLRLRVAVAVGQADQLAVTPQRLGPRGFECGPGGRGQAVQVLGREAGRQRPLAGGRRARLRCGRGREREQRDREEPDDELVEAVAAAGRPAVAGRLGQQHRNKFARRPGARPECAYSSWWWTRRAGSVRDEGFAKH